MPRPSSLSTTKKNSAVTTTMINTITEVIQVSCAAGPGDLARLGAHFAEELDWAVRFLGASGARPGRRGGVAARRMAAALGLCGRRDALIFGHGAASTFSNRRIAPRRAPWTII